jgi:hypothetical protein
VETNERRPWEGGVQDDDHGSGTKATLAVAADMRRRRDAAGRLPPLASGYRDPLDALAGLPITEADCCRSQFGAGGQWQPCCGQGAA